MGEGAVVPSKAVDEILEFVGCREMKVLGQGGRVDHVGGRVRVGVVRVRLLMHVSLTCQCLRTMDV